MTDQAQAQSPRSYHSPRRQAAARATRARIRQAARELFVADGYAATSVRSIASAAGVAEKTVYLQFPSKLDLLKEVVETAIVGDDEDVAAADRDWFRQIVDDPEPRGKVRRLVEATSALHERTGEVFAMARGAAASDPDAARLWGFGKAGHRADMGLLATSFTDAGMLPDGRDVEWATATLYVLIGPETWHLLRVELQCAPDEYSRWLGTALADAFDVQA